MKKWSWLALPLVALSVLPAQAVVQHPAPPTAAVVNYFDMARMQATLTRLGLTSEIKQMPQGFSLLVVTTPEGVQFAIAGILCTSSFTECKAVAFDTSVLRGAPSLETANKFNSEAPFAKLLLVPGGTPEVVQAHVILGGVTDDNLANVISTYFAGLKVFVDIMQQGQTASAAAPSVTAFENADQVHGFLKGLAQEMAGDAGHPAITLGLPKDSSTMAGWAR